jgi:hypothetical protein
VIIYGLKKMEVEKGSRIHSFSVGAKSGALALFKSPLCLKKENQEVGEII